MTITTATATYNKDNLCDNNYNNIPTDSRNAVLITQQQQQQQLQQTGFAKNNGPGQTNNF